MFFMIHNSVTIDICTTIMTLYSDDIHVFMSVEHSVIPTFPDKVGDNKYDKLPLNGNGFFLTLGDWCRGPLGEGLECPLWFLLSFSGEFEKRPMIASY
eukprot:m.180078 g.180078  ORF g.180078 m.180078 type:complete len:98 (+) comp15491_c0_seq2:2877-3170(+)